MNRENSMRMESDTTTDSIRFFRSVREAKEYIGLAVDEDDLRVDSLFPVLTNSYYLGLIRPEDGSGDPIYRQSLPDIAELADLNDTYDPLAEQVQSPVPRVIHRYKDRIVLLTTGMCAMHCRFCFRKRFWASGNHLDNITDEELAGAVEWLRNNPDVKEVLVTGGDPLFLPLSRLKTILDAVASVPSIEVIRLASRLPAVLPQAVTEEKIDLMASYDCLWLATHFNHPREVTDTAAALCRKIAGRGVPIINQTVLLKGVNDNADTLADLFRKLVRCKVKPHYLFHVDPVCSVKHFATGIDCGLEILKQFRSTLSSLAVPAFAIDLPEGGGKVNLQPDYRTGDSFPDIHDGHLISYYGAKYSGK